MIQENIEHVERKKIKKVKTNDDENHTPMALLMG